MDAAMENSDVSWCVIVPNDEYYIPVRAWSLSEPSVLGDYIKQARIAIERPTLPKTQVYATIVNVRSQHFELLTNPIVTTAVERIVETDQGNSRAFVGLILGGVDGLPDTDYYLMP